VVEVELGETARIKCNVSSPGESNYDEINWFYVSTSPREGGESAEIDRQIPKRVFQEDTEYKGRVEMEDFTLVIRRVTLQDTRTFKCQVKAGSSVVAEMQTQLHVYKTPEPPEIQVNDAGISVTSHELCLLPPARCPGPDPCLGCCFSRNPGASRDSGERRRHLCDESRDPKGGVGAAGASRGSPIAVPSQGSKSPPPHPLVCPHGHPQRSRLHQGPSRLPPPPDPTEKLRLEVQAPQPEVQEGEEVRLRCEGDGNPPPEYTLLKVKVSEGAGRLAGAGRALGSPRPADLEGIKITPEGPIQLQEGDALALTCDARGSKPLEFRYLEGIKITPEGPIQLQEGDALALTCDARGSKPLEFRWKKEKKGKLLGKSRQLKLSNVTHESSGSYSCEVAVAGVPGLAHSRQVYVGVHVGPAPPHISAKDSLVPVQQNEMVTLTCKAAALPEPTITWTVGGKVQNHSDHHRALSNLTVQVTSELLRSGVTCTATNKFGSSNHHIKLQLKRKSQESKGVIIVAVIVCILVIAVLGAVLYFLHKKGKIPCGRTGKQDITRPDARKEEIVVEVKSDKLPEEAGLLQGANGEKRPAGDQAEKYIDLRN
uniref:Melanoma cell adhesion molecule n=1 Tax=Pelodiscus sinensis TaxID=13735 RepID=K7G039_PELSI